MKVCIKDTDLKTMHELGFVETTIQNGHQTCGSANHKNYNLLTDEELEEIKKQAIFEWFDKVSAQWNERELKTLTSLTTSSAK